MKSLEELFSTKNFNIGQVEALMKWACETGDAVGFLADKDTIEFYRGQEKMLYKIKEACEEWLNVKRALARNKK